jgi:hypothetical protein
VEPHIIEGLIVPLAGMATGIILGLPVVRAIVKVVERKLGPGAGAAEVKELGAEIERLRAQVGGMEDMAYRLAELEERLDFTERVLAQHKEPQLPAGGGT